MKKTVVIDKDKCIGCGLCIPKCPKSIIKIIDGKATVVDEFFCDKLGGCVALCPQQAITIKVEAT